MYLIYQLMVTQFGDGILTLLAFFSQDEKCSLYIRRIRGPRREKLLDQCPRSYSNKQLTFGSLEAA
jgi:hypothetical protein